MDLSGVLCFKGSKVFLESWLSQLPCPIPGTPISWKNGRAVGLIAERWKQRDLDGLEPSPSRYVCLKPHQRLRALFLSLK